MSFLYPAFLVAAAAVAIPIIIHLFNFRSYRKVYFSNIAFLQKLYQQSHKRLTIKHLIVLLLRITAIILLVLAFAYPVENKQQNQLSDGAKVNLYIDNSFSMAAEGSQSSLFDMARNRLMQLVDLYPANTQFRLITNDLQLSDRAFVAPDQLLSKLADLKLSANSLKLSEVINTARQNRDADGMCNLFVISDFQQTMANWQELETDSMLNLRLVPLEPASSANLYIDSAWFDNPTHIVMEDEVLKVRVVNHSAEALESLAINLQVNGEMRSVNNANLQAGESKVLEINFRNKTAGHQYLQVSLESYPIAFDNDFYLSYEVVDKIRMMVLADKVPNKYFKALGATFSLLSLRQEPVASIPVSEVLEQDIVVLHGVSQVSEGLRTQLVGYIKQGGSVVLWPDFELSAQENATMWPEWWLFPKAVDDTAQTLMSSETMYNPLWRRVVSTVDKSTEMPKLKRRFMFEGQIPEQWNVLLADRLNNPLFVSQAIGDGVLYIAFYDDDFSQSDFVMHPLFAAMWASLPIESKHQWNSNFVVGKDNDLALSVVGKPRAETLELKGHDNKFSMMPAWYINPSTKKLIVNTGGHIELAGQYDLWEGNTLWASLAFNYNRLESLMEYLAFDDALITSLKSLFPNMAVVDASDVDLFAESVKDAARGSSLWRLLLVGALLAVAAEVLVLRFWP